MGVKTQGLLSSPPTFEPTGEEEHDPREGDAVANPNSKWDGSVLMGRAGHCVICCQGPKELRREGKCGNIKLWQISSSVEITKGRHGS